MDLVNDDLPYRFGLWIWRFHIYLIDSTYRFGTWLRGGSLPHRLAYRFGIYICSNAHWRQTFQSSVVYMMRLVRISQRAFFSLLLFNAFGQLWSVSFYPTYPLPLLGCHVASERSITCEFENKRDTANEAENKVQQPSCRGSTLLVLF